MDESLDLIQSIYREIHKKLTAPFPAGTVEGKENDSNQKFIPVQPYIHRLEEAAGVHWSFKMTGQPIIYEAEDLVQVNGVLKILNAEREGNGFSNLQRYRDTRKIRNLKEAIRAACSDCLRDCCNLFEMGWRDLAPYRKWSNNPGVGLKTSAARINGAESEDRTCIRCKEKLTEEDERLLKELKVSVNYCASHIPDHLTRNRKK